MQLSTSIIMTWIEASKDRLPFLNEAHGTGESVFVYYFVCTLTSRKTLAPCSQLQRSCYSMDAAGLIILSAFAVPVPV